MTRLAIPELLRVAPGTRPKLGALDAASTPGFDGDRDAARDRLEELRGELGAFQERLWAEGSQALLIVLQALDAGGKDGLIRNVITAFNPQGTRVTAFGVPTEEELGHDYLWRVHAATPGKGRIGVFNRSHYEDVLVVRVSKLAPPSVWKHRYEQINGFEATLAANSTRIVKLYLQISRAEQRERFLKRLTNPRSSGSGHPRTWRPARTGRTTGPRTRMRWRAAPRTRRPGSSFPPITSGTATLRPPRSWLPRPVR